MRQFIKLLGMAMAISLCLPMVAFAAKAHTQTCNECHKAGINPRTTDNLCTPCHGVANYGDFIALGKPQLGALDRYKASGALNHRSLTDHTDQGGDQTSHFWGGISTTQVAAGTTNPTTALYNSRYALSKNRVTCSICHNPHGDMATTPKLLRASTAGDLICQQCHVNFYKDYTNAILTHPVGSTAIYANALLAKPTNYKPTPADAAPGVVGLVNGVVSCSSCHAPHFADSDSSTPDGGVNVSLMVPGDGHLLKANGPAKADNSLLCQACHTYQAHGKVSDGGESVGCLTCHSGHIIVGNNNVYVLRNSVTTATNGTKTITYSAIDTPWNDNTAVTATGYCEVCHGSAETIPKQSGYHLVASICKDCHMHQVDGGVYSFQNDANVATCGDCHGFPPYKDIRGDRLADAGAFYAARDGGYAYKSATHNYALDGVSGGYKSEVTTPHNTHAAGGLTQGNAATDYIFGAGILACDPCHFDLSTAATHDQVTAPGSYQSLAWNPLSTGNGVLSPSYATSGGNAWKCSNTYCHSNGGKRNATGTKVIGDYTVTLTPAWALGDGKIVGQTTPTHQCSFCHGNTAATMVTKNNSTSHQKHLGTGTLLKTYSCKACHNSTADSSTGLATTGTNPRLIKDGGTHVNGSINVSFNSTYSLGSASLGAGTYVGAANGTCTVYCHSNGKGSTITIPDWDVAASGACGTCHSTAGASLSAPHAKHLAIATVTCADCHGTNAATGTHTGHVDGAFTYSQTSCNNCHGWETGETTPAWGQPMNNDYCITCHTGATVGVVKTMTAPTKQHANTRGHNATANYTSGNLPGNKICTSCHLTSINNHVNVTDGDATHLEAVATTCTATCHGVGGSAVKDGIITHVAKACTACHDPHGDTTQTTNIFMIRSKSTGNFASDATPVVFTNRGNDSLPLTALQSFDEDDGAAGHPGEVNADDLCATCHTVAGGSGHNNRDNTPTTGSHHQGETCMSGSCHKPHTEATGAFKAGGGSACNSCHDNPPNTGAHGVGNNKHTRVASLLVDEDRTDCAVCHTGADLYTYDPTADQAAGGARGNHNMGDVNQKAVLTASVGYNTTSFNCTTACHLSTAGDGAWTDANGLNCTACHYYVAGATSSANNTAAAPKDLKGSHNVHFAKTKPCTACHTVPTDTTHISVPTGTDLQKIQSRATAVQDEADVLVAIATQNDPGNETCSGAGVGLGCHNTKTTPAWTTSGITCTNCHVVTGSATADPKTGLHNIGVTEAAAGVQKHDSTLPGGCTACHNSTKPATHTDGTFNNDTAVRTDRFLTVKVGMFVDNATANRGTCSGTGNLSGCHSDGGNWTRLWSTEANSTATTSGSARCNVCHGQYSTLSGSAGLGWNPGNSHYKTYGNATSTRGVSHKSQAGENNACEDCHSFTTIPGNHDTVTHQITMNDDAATVQVTEASSRVYCAYCHATGDPLLSGTYTFTQSVFPIQRVAGANDPKQECNNCHGDGTGRYWPMGAYGAGNAANDGGRHEIHMTRLSKSVYNQTVVQLLADVDVKNKQIELCKYCHNATVPGTNPGHNDSALPAEVSSTMYALWDTTKSTADAVTYTGTGANGTGTCANSNCHNGKNTNSVANFTWHGTGTQNCLLCHNDITVTTAGTTGATHAAHTGSAATFGKDITCASCHGGSVTWSPYVVPTNDLHINGAFNVGTSGGGSVSFTYGGTYTNAATRTVGSCGVNLCHNNGKNAAAPAYTWQTAIAGCAACHATSTTLGGSHNSHLVASFATTFGKTASCADCHDAVSAASMAGKTAHMNGAVTLAAGLTYSGAPGTLDVTLATLGDCTGSCHTNGKAAAPVTAATWNSTYTNCNICHGLPNSAGNDGARHLKHIGNTAKVAASCGECHLTATTTTYNSANHLNSTINTGNKISAHTVGTETCTNSCHLVNSARGDWLDTAALACTDCHQIGSSYIGEAAKPVRATPNGLHKATVALAHDDTFGAGGTCTSCHTGVTVDSPATHVNGVNTDANTTYGLFANYNTSTNTCYASCHADGGDWARKWVGVVDAKPLHTDAATAAVCGNCHGSFAQGWRFVNEAGASTTDHTDPETVDNTGDQMNTTGHQVCSKCHGWGVAAYQSATKHQNNNLTMNSDLGYTDGTGGCTTNCHGGKTLTMQSNSGFTNDSGAYGVLSCGSCHNDGAIPPNSGAHAAHGADADADYTECEACHGTDNGGSWAPGTGGSHNTGTVNFAAGITYSNGGTPGTDAASLNDTCSTTQCHSKSPEVATWGTPASLGCDECHNATATVIANTNGRTLSNPSHGTHFAKGKTCNHCHTVPGSGRTHVTTNGANDGAVLTSRANAAQDEATVTITDATISGGNTCSGTTGISIGCHNTKTTPAWGSTGITCSNCHVPGGGAAYDPTSGLHNMTATNVQKHNSTLRTGCTECHASMTSDPASHIDGAWLADGPTNQTVGGQPRFLSGTRTGMVYTEGAANASTCWDNGATGASTSLDYNAGGSCHRDNGVWKRQWSTNANVDISVSTAPGQLVCDVCHGQYQSLNVSSTGWREGSVHYRSGADGALENKGVSHNRLTGVTNACQDCHAYASAAPHENGVLNFDGLGTNNPDTFTLTMGTTGWYCATCHNTASGDVATLTTSHTFPDSTAITTRAYVAGTSYPEGGCTGCHGNSSTGGFWPDGSTGHTANVAGHHVEHVDSIAAKMAGGATLANKNLTCNFCHPGNTHGGADGVEPADVSMTDANNDGTADAETGTKFKRIISPFASDTTGIWRSTPKTCSNVACHANAPFTPHWYSDSVAPGNVTDLAAAANTEPGTVKLNWTAPGNDGSLDGTAYRYDVRYSTATINDANFAAASQAKAPTVDRMGKAQSTIVNGLTPGSTYFYALKTYDETGNVSALSNVVSRAAQVDNVAPVFWGINAVTTEDFVFNPTPNPDTNGVLVTWDAARDHSHSLSTPLNYVVMWSEYSLRTHFSNNGAMPSTIGTDACFSKLAPNTQVTCGSVVPATNEYRIKSMQTTALKANINGLPVGTVYNFMVRAKDASGNVDNNRAEMMCMAKSTVIAPRTLKTLYTSAAVTPAPTTGADTLTGALGTAYPGTAPSNLSLTQNDTVTWSPAANYTEMKTIYGLSFQIRMYNPNSAVTMSYQLGYLTGSTFSAIKNRAGANIAAKTYSIGRRATRVIKFPLGDYIGTIPAGSKPAFRLTITGATSTALTVYYGSTANKGGILLFNEQPYNDLPTGLGSLNQTQVANTFVGGPVYRLTWNAANPTPNAVDTAQTVHYDVFGSIDGGTTWPYVIGHELTTPTVDWDPVGDGITGNQTNVMFKVMAGDGYRSGNLYSKADADQVNHSEVISAAFTVNNTADIWTPAAITTLAAETRPKQGSVYLSWKAVGNDGFNHGTRATQYDIRYNTATINDGNWAASTAVTNEPFPEFTGAIEGYELLGLNDDEPYYFAMKVGDQAGNWSALSNIATTQSGPKCGICHSTPPDESATAGNHAKHGYTKNDCGNCHGTAAASFNVDHQDGILNLGYKTANAYPGIIAGSRLYYTTDGTSGGTVIYDDTTGAGGFVNTGGDQSDNGTCSGFNAANASGCHGPATPSWNVAATLVCSACHGTSGRTTDTYGRDFDATLDNAGVVPDEVKASPAVDNHGTSTGKYVGAHLKHLNSSFRLAKGDNCKLCHNDSVHADGTVDVVYDLNVTGAGALWTPNASGAGTPGTCGGTSTTNCHGSNVPTWDSAATVACVQCHGFAGVNPAHVTDASTVRACTWCHPAGHPQGTVQDTNSIMIPNNPLVGIAYRSGGIHLLKNINSRGAKTTEAEVCWTCHDAQGTKITEWGANTDTLTGSTPYNYGNLFTAVGFTGPTSNWLGLGTGAYWQSGTSAFQTIKKGKIQSTHSANGEGTSVVVYDATNKRYNETLDTVANLRCSNCHDVHNMNKAPDDTATGTPYLRGTWMGNPYQEDGPPLSTTTYAGVAIGSYNFGAIPRGGTGYRRLGGYFIDQNNVVPGTATATTMATLDDYPTAGWTQESSAGLCILCHGNDVDNMDQKTGESLWLGTNGHSNSAIGGTFTNSANIFDTGVGTASLSGRPNSVYTTSYQGTTQVPDMAYQMQPNSPSTTRGYGYRGATDGAGYLPQIATDYAHYAYDWGATVDAGTTDQMYHQFSCSKCHNPHASRLPKLLITNCLDVQHNTWTTARAAQNSYTAATLTNVDRGWTAAYYASAQNCHRYNDKRTAANKGGWNIVSPWTTANQ